MRAVKVIVALLRRSKTGAILTVIIGAVWVPLLSASSASFVMPGLKPTGFTLLHNQWLIRPAGRQIELGDFPVNMVVDRSGRYAAVLHAGYTAHQVWVVDLRTKRRTDVASLHETFYGMAFSPDGKTLVCSGGSDEVLHVFTFVGGKLSARPDIRVTAAKDPGVVAGVAFSPDGKRVVVSLLFDSKLVCVDVRSGKVCWTTSLDKAGAEASAFRRNLSTVPNVGFKGGRLKEVSDPLDIVWDSRDNHLYVSLWGESAVAVLDAASGEMLARWRTGLHPNELLLDPRGQRLFVSNSGRNTVTVLDTATGRPIETLCSALSAEDPPGSTPDSLALTPDGKDLFVANADNDNVAVFDVSKPSESRPLGFVPTGWFPTAVRLTPDGHHLLVISARGLQPKADSIGSPTKYPYIATLYRGSLGIVGLSRGEAFDRKLARWTHIAQHSRPIPPQPPERSDNPIPERVGEPSPIRYVIYVIKENRTYDQVFGDIAEGNGDPALCLFPEKVTPNLHGLVRDFVLLDNFYCNAEVSASGHEWSMGAYASDFVNKTWPVEYGHQGTKVPYPGEGQYLAAVPALGYLWDRAAAAGVSYYDYAEFVVPGRTPANPGRVTLPALRDHFDPYYRGFDLKYHDIDRVARFITDLHGYEATGKMPRLQIMRIPGDHTAGPLKGAWTPAAMVADNDLAVGRLVEAVSHSKFWPQTAIFIVEDDAQNGPDHVDAHRTEALVISPWCRRHFVDSTPYTTCSMLRTMELILGLQPMSQFDAAATPMWACFQSTPDLKPWTALPARINIDARNPGGTEAAREAATFDFSREDLVNDQAFNRVIWAAMRGPHSVMPAPVHSAFVRPVPGGEDDDN